jgi:hypothetical protein
MNTTRGMVKTMKKGSRDQEILAAPDTAALVMRRKRTSPG